MKKSERIAELEAKVAWLEEDMAAFRYEIAAMFITMFPDKAEEERTLWRAGLNTGSAWIDGALLKEAKRDVLEVFKHEQEAAVSAARDSTISTGLIDPGPCVVDWTRTDDSVGEAWSVALEPNGTSRPTIAVKVGCEVGRVMILDGGLRGVSEAAIRAYTSAVGIVRAQKERKWLNGFEETHGGSWDNEALGMLVWPVGAKHERVWVARSGNRLAAGRYATAEAAMLSLMP